MKRFKKVFLLMVIVFLLGATVVCATNGPITITPDDTTIGGETPTNTTQNRVTNTTKVPTTTVNTSNYNNTTNLPKTGADDYLIISVVAVLGIVGVYAYKKINDYKDI